MKRFSAFTLVVLVALAPSCSLLEEVAEMLGDGNKICLDEVLGYAGLERGAIDDDLLAITLAASADVLGELPVKDCQARSKSDGLVKKISDGGGATTPTDPDLPEKARDGQVVEADGPQDLPDKLDEVVDQGPGQDADVAVLIDTTGSMWDDLDAIVTNLDDILATVESKGGRVAIAWYGDNMSCDAPWYGINPSGLLDPTDPEVTDFADDTLNNGLSGGCDWPESMYDAIVETANSLNWESADRTIVVITDAEALTGDKTNYSEDDVAIILDEHKIALDLILTAVTY